MNLFTKILYIILLVIKVINANRVSVHHRKLDTQNMVYFSVEYYTTVKRNTSFRKIWKNLKKNKFWKRSLAQNTYHMVPLISSSRRSKLTHTYRNLTSSCLGMRRLKQLYGWEFTGRPEGTI
jgi:hypothetical protein